MPTYWMPKQWVKTRRAKRRIDTNAAGKHSTRIIGRMAASRKVGRAEKIAVVGLRLLDNTGQKLDHLAAWVL